MNWIKKALRSKWITFLVFLLSFGILLYLGKTGDIALLSALGIFLVLMSIALLGRAFRSQDPHERERVISGGQLSAMPRWLRRWVLDEPEDHQDE